MRKSFSAVLFVFAMFAVTTPLAAQNLEVGGWFTMDRIDETANPAGMFDPGRSTGYMLSVNKFFGATSVELAGAYQIHDTTFTATDSEDSVDIGQLQVVPLTATIQRHFLRDSLFSPYIGVGVAYLLTGDVEEDILSEELDIELIEISDEISWTAQVGINFILSETLAVGLEAKYIPVTAESHFIGNAGTGEGVDFEMNTLMISAGLKYRW